MPRYYFNVHDGRFFSDEVGTELPDLAAARRLAVVASGEAIKDLAEQFWDTSEWRMDVSDEQGKVLFTLRLTSIEPASIRQTP